jgi:hypothetical protein
LLATLDGGDLRFGQAVERNPEINRHPPEVLDEQQIHPGHLWIGKERIVTPREWQRLR